MILKIEKPRNNNMNTLKYKHCKKSLQDFKVLASGEQYLKIGSI